MIKILVAYTTNAGTTVQAAQAVSEGLSDADTTRPRGRGR